MYKRGLAYSSMPMANSAPSIIFSTLIFYVLMIIILLQASNDLFHLIDNLLQYPDQALQDAHEEFNASSR